MTTRRIDQRVASSASAQANGTPIRVAGQQVSVSIEAPAALALVQISDDLRVWTTATSRVDGTTALSTLADATRNELYERPEWIRPAVATDGSGPRNFDFVFVMREEE